VLLLSIQKELGNISAASFGCHIAVLENTNSLMEASLPGEGQFSRSSAPSKAKTQEHYMETTQGWRMKRSAIMSVLTDKKMKS
jgi:hypothetical protein